MKSGKSEHSHRLKFFFWIVTLSVPLILLAALEVLLYLFQYGGNLDLVVKQTVSGRQMYAVNRSVGRRYFAGYGTVIPEPAEDTFEIDKLPGTKRIFCLGESTMAGFPYDFHATVPSLLRTRLGLDLHKNNIEVINLGLSAVGSFIILDLLKEVVEYEPDLIIIYSGHNEFYGAYGAASTVGFGNSEVVTRSTLFLLNFRTFLFLRDILNRIPSLFASSPKSSSRPLMAEMIGEESIRRGSDLYESGRRLYRENLGRMIETARDHDVPILFSSLVSNIRHHAPFRSEFSSANPQTMERWNLVMKEGTSQLRSGSAFRAAELFGEAVQIDSGHAMAWYRFATALDSLGEYVAAADAYTRARDEDLLRFRASGDFESDLILTCRTFDVPLAPVDSAFDRESPQGMPGRELFTEHLHPNIRGYALMAKTIHETIRESGLVVSGNFWKEIHPATEKEYFDHSAVSIFDTLVGEIKTEILLHQWPFTEQSERYRFHPGDGVESIVHEYVRGRIFWSKARYDLAEYFAGAGRFDLARKECLAVSRVLPTSYEPLLRIADYYRREGLDDAAADAYKQCYTVQDNPYARMKLAILYLEKKDPASANAEIEKAFRAAEKPGLSLTLEAQANGLYLLAVAKANLGKLQEAKGNAEQALRFNPADTSIRDLLAQIKSLLESQAD